MAREDDIRERPVNFRTLPDYSGIRTTDKEKRGINCEL